MKRLVLALLFIYPMTWLAACSNQWREGDLSLNASDIQTSLSFAFSQSGDSAAQAFQQIYNSGTAHLYYAEAVQGKTTLFGTGIDRVFPMTSWASLGFTAAKENIQVVRAYFIENNSQSGSQYGLLLNVESGGSHEVKAFIAEAAQIDGGELILQMSGGLVLRSFDIVDQEVLADVIQFEIYDSQGQFIGKLSTLIAL